MDAYGEYCIRVAYLYVKDWEAAEEIVQDVFLAYYRQQDRFEGRASLKTYLVKITVYVWSLHYLTELKSTYGLKVQLEGTGKEWLDIPKSFSKLEILLEQEPLFQFDVGTIKFREEGNAYVDTFSVDQLQPLAELLHERQK